MANKVAYVRSRTNIALNSALTYAGRAMPTDVGQQVLAKAVEKLGGPDLAAARLGISATLIRRFLDGDLLLPDQILLKAVDLVFGAVEPVPAVLPESPKPKGPIVI